MPSLSQASADSLPYTFAGCVGRLSAEMEHAWLVSDARAPQLMTDRQALIDLMEATQDPNDAKRVLHHRIETKMAHAALLTQATFGPDARMSRNAEKNAVRLLASCRQLVLGS